MVLIIAERPSLARNIVAGIGKCARPDVEKIVNAGDADREGEIIIRLCVEHTGVQKPFYRLWLPDQTPETVAEALSAMKEESEYRLYHNKIIITTSLPVVMIHYSFFSFVKNLHDFLGNAVAKPFTILSWRFFSCQSFLPSPVEPGVYFHA